MPSDIKMFERARDELFSHINRCGVLQAAEDDQRVWMDETIDYIGERYPDLTDSDLRDLYTVGVRFCKPVIRYGSVAEPAAGTSAKSPPLKVASAAPAAASAPASDEPSADAEQAETPSESEATVAVEDVPVA